MGFRPVIQGEAACSSANRGAVRLNMATSGYQVCNGTQWEDIAFGDSAHAKRLDALGFDTTFPTYVLCVGSGISSDIVLTPHLAFTNNNRRAIRYRDLSGGRYIDFWDNGSYMRADDVNSTCRNKSIQQLKAEGRAF